MGFIEAGQSDFFVPRGYVHVVANVRGTGGSGGTFGFFDGQERRDMHDLVQWAGQQPWSDGNVGMIGISYFATDPISQSNYPGHVNDNLWRDDESHRPALDWLLSYIPTSNPPNVFASP